MKERTRANPWDKIDELRSSAGLQEDATPPSAFTQEAYRQQYHISRSTACRELRSFVETGGFKTGFARRKDSRGRQILQNVYWPA